MLQYEEIAPSLPLREYLECYWILQTDFSLNQELCLPDGSASLIFNFGPNYFRAVCHEPNHWKEYGRCTLPHQGKDCVLISQKKPVRILGVRFKPHGMAPFFKVSMTDFVPPFIVDGENLRPFTGDLEAKLWAVESFKEKIEVLEHDFTRRLPGLPPPDELVTAAVKELMRQEGNLKIGELHELLCVSKSTLEKKFQEHVGLSPKILSNIFRFNSLVYNQQQEPEISLTELSYSQGFFDQSHLVNNFKSFTGKPPGRYFRQANLRVEMLRQTFEKRATEIY